MKFDIIKFQEIGDSRGSLISLEAGNNVPFKIERVYYIFGTQAEVRRGYHAHKSLRQLCVAVKGSCKFHLTDGTESTTHSLASPDEGLLLQGCLWREMYDFSPDCVLLILADQHYDEADYIRDYSEFLRYVQKSQTSNE